MSDSTPNNEDQDSRLERIRSAFRSTRPKEDENLRAQVNIVIPPAPPPPAPGSETKPPEETPPKKEPEARNLNYWSPQQSAAQSLDQTLIQHRMKADEHAFATRYEANDFENVKATVAYERRQFLELVGIEPEHRRAALLEELRQAEATKLKREMRDWFEMRIPSLLQGHQRYYSTPAPLKATPAEAMPFEVRQRLEAWQTAPEEAGVIQIASLLAEAIERKLLVVLVIDTSPYLRIAGGRYSGRFGGGKSQLLWQILTWAYGLLGLVFDPRKDVVYRQDRARLQRLLSEEEHVPIGVDEGNQFFDERDWNKPENKGIVKDLEMYRKTGRPLVIACSSIWNLDERMRHKIITHRLQVDEWDADAYTGAATLFVADGPPKAQVEEENKWGSEIERIRFNGLTHEQFRFYEEITVAAQAWEEKGGLDALLKKDPDWLAEFVPKPPVLPELGPNGQVVAAADGADRTPGSPAGGR